VSRLRDVEGGTVIKGLKFASIPVTNQDRAVEFYTNALGFTIMTDQEFDGTQRWIELGIPGAETRIVLFTPDEHRDRIGGFSNLAFWSDNVERTAGQMAAKGVEFTQPVKRESWGTSAIFKDPDGNQFVLGSK
jgi:predicted enzyme related to lactoylglutathione lyase